jgi:hypothetical protein
MVSACFVSCVGVERDFGSRSCMQDLIHFYLDDLSSRETGLRSSALYFAYVRSR